MKKVCILIVALILGLCAGCGVDNDRYDNNEGERERNGGYSYNDYSNNDSYDYDKGYGYTAPKDGESFSDYLKRQDPDLYDSITDRYNNLY